MKAEATIRQWATGKNWGIANERFFPGQTPRRFFDHGSKALTPEIEAQLGVRVKILFVIGPPRQPGELNAALEIELSPTQKPREAAVEAKPEVSPESENVGGSL